MERDDEHDNGHDDIDYALQREEPMQDKSSEGGFDPMDIANPVSAYFFLSDDAQDEVSGSDKKRMKCLFCGHRFMGETYDSCPECHRANTDEVVAGIDGEEEVAGDAKMKCLDCGHQFSGEICDSCPEFFSSDTEELEDEANETVSLFE